MGIEVVPEGEQDMQCIPFAFQIDWPNRAADDHQLSSSL